MREQRQRVHKCIWNCFSLCAPIKIGVHLLYMKVSTKIWLKKQKYNLLTVVIAAGAVGGLAWSARPEPPLGFAPEVARQNAAGSGDLKLYASKTDYDFGTISMRKGNVEYAFQVKNNTDMPLTIAKLYTSCMCTTASLIRGEEVYGPFGMPGHGSIPSINQTLVPGEKVTVAAMFNPNAHGPAGVGPVRRAIYLEGAEGEKFELRISANVIP